MILKELVLRDFYPFLADSDARVTVCLQNSFSEGDCSGGGILTSGKRPVLVVCPGGAYRKVSEREGEPVALAFAPLGFQLVLLHYSVAPARYPTQLLELAAALELLCRNADAWSIDKAHITLAGFSAGGHLVSSYCTMRDRREITRHLQPVDVFAAILGYPVITAEPFSHLNSFRNLLGVEELTDELVHLFSSDRHVRLGLTPQTFLWHCEGDRNVDVRNSLLYRAALQAQGIPCRCRIFKSGRHGLSTADCQSVHDFDTAEMKEIHGWIAEASEWLREIGACYNGGAYRK